MKAEMHTPIIKTKLTTSTGIQYLFLFGLCLVYAFALIKPNVVTNCYYVAVVAALIGLALARKKLYGEIWLPVVFIVFSVARWIWLGWQGHPQITANITIYNNYWHVSKSMFWGAPLFFYGSILSQREKRIISMQWMSRLLYSVSLVISLVSFWLYWHDHQDRVAIGGLVSTSAAYLMTIYHLLALNQFIASRVDGTRSSYKIWCLIPLILIVQFYSIVITGTRSAFVIYPSGVMLMLLLNAWRTRKFTYLWVGGIILSLAFVVGYKSLMEPRVESFKSDIKLYTAGSTQSTSMGERLAMWNAGLYSTRMHPMGETIDQRRITVQNAIKEGKINPQAMDYIHDHLHNEMLEMTSMQGIWGGGLLLLLYGSIARFAFKVRDAGRDAVIIILASTIAFGLGDVFLIWNWYITFFISSIALVTLAYGMECDLEVRYGNPSRN